MILVEEHCFRSSCECALLSVELMEYKKNLSSRFYVMIEVPFLSSWKTRLTSV